MALKKVSASNNNNDEPRGYISLWRNTDPNKSMVASLSIKVTSELLELINSVDPDSYGNIELRAFLWEDDKDGQGRPDLSGKVVLSNKHLEQPATAKRRAAPVEPSDEDEEPEVDEEPKAKRRGRLTAKRVV